MIYLDSAAVIKLIREEDETPELVDYLNARGGQRLVASALIEVEVPRALRRSEPAVLGAVAATIARIDRVEIDNAVRAIAGAYTDPHLRSLDAIHLATPTTSSPVKSTFPRSSPTTNVSPNATDDGRLSPSRR